MKRLNAKVNTSTGLLKTSQGSSNESLVQKKAKQSASEQGWLHMWVKSE